MQAVLFELDFGPEDDPGVSIAALGIPALAGFLIGRWWAVALSLAPVVLFVVDPDEAGDLSLGVVIWVSVLLTAIALAIGVGVRRAGERERPA